MSKKIRLDKDKAIVFMGTMNAAPMMYALKLRALGYEVIYFVDVPREDTLSRPENHFPGIEYPYPAWILECVLPSQILLPLFPRLFLALYLRRVRQAINSEIGLFVLNGFFTSLAPHLPQSASKLAFSHSSDLDIWANKKSSEALCDGHCNRSIFKYLPKRATRYIIDLIIKRQYCGYANSDTVAYFPIGFHPAGDAIVRQLVDLGVSYVPRYDVSFEPLQGESRRFKPQSGKLQIFSGVRFMYQTFSEGYSGANKGNDLIISGIARYFAHNPEIEVHFVEKGEDVESAKELCRKLGLEQVVVWHKEMPFKELLRLYRDSDVCFDQVGAHWIGAIGCYALYLGKPLIANDELAVRSGIWPAQNPICSARSADEVCAWLEKLEKPGFRRSVSDGSKRFAEAYIGPERALYSIFELSSAEESR